MHWQLGEQDMARYAVVVPFSIITPSGSATMTSGSAASSTSGAKKMGKEILGMGRQVGGNGNRSVHRSLPGVADLEKEVKPSLDWERDWK